jgi:hypothetical protein
VAVRPVAEGQVKDAADGVVSIADLLLNTQKKVASIGRSVVAFKTSFA